MAFLNRSERQEAEAFARMGYTNPFLSERLELERQILGDRYQAGAAVIHLPADFRARAVFQNFSLLLEHSQILSDKMRQRVVAGKCKREQDQELYRETVIFHLYGKYFSSNQASFGGTIRDSAEQVGKCWPRFRKDYDWYLNLPQLALPSYFDAAHCFAIFFQIDRAFLHIFKFIVGSSMPIAKLRAAVWESIFTHDMRRYIRGVHQSMRKITTLITGKSGTGKELVAQAIGRSQYQAFNPKTEKFDDAAREAFFPVNLSALSSTLVESELFGHRKGSFTGAVADRKGWLEVCPENGTVFLDEIGELELSIQVKLLRVLQSREFSPVGDTKPRRFAGKFIAATNRDLAAEITKGNFREDLYYRLCADIIHTPTLQEQLLDRPEDLLELTHYIARKLLIDLPEEADSLAREAIEWIEQHFGNNYDWPGNIREVEQCVSNVLIRKSYRSSNRLRFPLPDDPACQPLQSANRLVQSMLAGTVTLEEVSEYYASLAYAQLGRYDLAAERLGIDWRTLRDKVQDDLVRQFKGSLP
jgi:DNA-binding NtrC family response regulator